jgi:pyridoxine 5-phosphate synthase
VTTEGGLDLLSNQQRVADAIARLRAAGIGISLFLDPDLKQLDAAKALGADAVELHTGEYAGAVGEEKQSAELAKLKAAAAHILQLGMTLHAGHGLTYRNVKPIAAIEGMSELNIGHSIVARALMVGFEQAVREMKRLIA